MKSTKTSIIDFYLIFSDQKTNSKLRLSAINSCTRILSTSPNNTFTTEEFLYCLSKNLVQSCAQIRAASLRLSRYILKTPNDLQIFNSLQLPFLVCRSLDLVVKNEDERIQALKLIRKMILISPELVSPSIVRCLASLGDTLMIEGTKPDRIVRACLATLSELGVLNPTLLIISNGVSVILRNVLECDSPRIAESLIGVLLHLLDYPHTRLISGIRLDCLATPYCDFTYRLGIMDKNKDARELRFKCSRLALLSVLRTFNGTIEFCNPNKVSGLKAIIDILFLNQLEVRKAVIDLLYDLIGLPMPCWTDEYSVALAAVDPSDYQDSWRLSEGFVALEGRCILPSLINKVPNICEIHQALLLYCFIENGLLNALVEVIISSDTLISVRATILLARLLQLIHTTLPSDLCSTPLPLLISKATEGNNLQAKAALSAISALQSYHSMIKNRPAACSMYLDCIIQNGDLIKSRLFKREINAVESLSKSASLTLFERMRHDSVSSVDANGSYNYYYEHLRDTTSLNLSGGDNETNKERAKRSTLIRQKVLGFFEKFRENERLIKDSLVINHVDPAKWDWDIIVTIFRNKNLSTKLDENQLKFIKTLAQYFKPSSNKFSHMELGMGRVIPPNVHAGIMLIDYLLEQIDELEYMRILTDYFTDISSNLQAIYKKKAHDCLFSPSHMNTTMCQQYFLFIGRMCRSKKGVDILRNTDIIKHLTYLVANTNHTIYVKLIVSGLDYSLQNIPRLILEKALTASPNQTSRLYATQFLLVLLRARLPTFEEWGIPLIMNQLKDKDRAIMLATLEILEEACHENIYLLELAHVWPQLDKYHEMGKYIMMRFYSIPRGLNHPKANVKDEIELWINIYNKKYVMFVESEIHSSMTLHQRNEDGYYMSRNSSSNQRQVAKTTNIPCHLYGALVQTTLGLNNLQKYGNVIMYIDVLTQAKCSNEEECLQLKSALWVIGHVSTNNDGIEFLNNPVTRVFEKVIHLAKLCEVYSIRSTAFNVICLMSSTVCGSNLLHKLDWLSVRHDRNNEFPVIEPEDWHLKNPAGISRYNMHDVPAYNYGNMDDSIMNSGATLNPSFFIEESSDSIREEDDEQNEPLNMTTSTQRSRTLPAGILPSQIYPRSSAKHIRSLSESKTTDGITKIMSTSSRTRFNSGDSNTSDLSSDSTNTKTLINERFRRVSLTGTPIQDSQISNQDVHGYKKLRMIRQNIRPMLSESAAEDIMLDVFDTDDKSRTSNRLLQSFNLDSKRRAIQKRNTKAQTITNSGFDDIQKNIYVAKLLTQVDTKGPCYRGICLPKNILELFPDDNQNTTSRYIQEIETLESNNLSISSILTRNQYINEAETAAGDSVSNSSLSDLSAGNKRKKRQGTTDQLIENDNQSNVNRSVSSGGGSKKHNKNECLACCRNKIRIDTTLNIKESKDITSTNVGSKPQESCDVSFYSPESVVSDDSANMPDRISTVILRNFQKMANPILFKTCRKILMELKQKYPLSFQDICLYSEVCKYMSMCNYRMTVRRFIQEIFLDLNYDVFNNDIDLILNVARQRLVDQNLLDTSKTFPISSPSSSSTTNTTVISSPSSTTTTTTTQVSSLSHKFKSPLLASVIYESSIENLIDPPKSSTKDEVDSIISNNNDKNNTSSSNDNNNKNLQSTNNDNNKKSSLGSSQKVTAEIHGYNRTSDHLIASTMENIQPVRRRRFNTLELDLSCTKNKFPIKHRSSNNQQATTSIEGARPVSLSANNSDVEHAIMSKNFSTSDHSFESTRSVTSPLSPFSPLYCEQRLIQSSRSEESNINKKNNNSSDRTNDAREDDTDHIKKF